jgi:hypothetical protein
VLVNAQVSHHFAFAFQPTDRVFAMMLNVFVLDTYAAFSALQSCVHETWARFFGSSMKDDLRYTPSDCFETFPFPDSFATLPSLEQIGREYYEFRAQLMVRNDEGLTKTYNRFHDPNERSGEIVHLRELHEAMDRVVLDAYGWADLSTNCEFLPIHPADDGEEEPTRFRYRWPDEIRDEVLARLLALNAQRAEEERLAGAAPDGKATGKGPARRAKRVSAAQASFQTVGKPEA